MATLTGEETEQLAQSALTRNPVFALRQLRVEREDDHLLIQGRVSSFYHKQLAQEAVRAAVPQVELVNSIDVD